jgi:hypothetical protein
MKRTMKTERYNGWKNRETWCVSLWIDNKRTTYETARRMAEKFRRGGTRAGQESVYPFADALKKWIEDELVPDLGASMASDLLNTALGRVDYDEIAKHILEE